MKQNAVFLAATVLLGAVASSSVRAEQDVCDWLASQARQIMKARQYGYEMSKALAQVRELATRIEQDAEADGAAGAGATVGRWLESMVDHAYERPRFSTDQYRQDAITDFASNAMLDCRRAFK
jgi:hypothetical protein